MIAELIDRSLIGHRSDDLDELDGGWADGHDPNGREDAKDERRHHLDAGLRGGFFCPLTPFRPDKSSKRCRHPQARKRPSSWHET
jgi:hypothetical protein